jgi:hypothetical protein
MGITRLPHTLTAAAVVDTREADTGHNPQAEHRDVGFVLPAADAPHVRDLLIDAIIELRLSNTTLKEQHRARLEKARATLKAHIGARELRVDLPGWIYVPPFLDTEHVKRAGDSFGWTIAADATPVA